MTFLTDIISYTFNALSTSFCVFFICSEKKSLFLKLNIQQESSINYIKLYSEDTF